MKALRLHQYNVSPVIEEVPEPKISSPFDVIVRIGGAGLCRTDLHIIYGQLKDRVKLPHILGHENAGWVEAIGSEVSNLVPGDPVIVHPLITCGLCRSCRTGDDMRCESSSFSGITASGGMAELLKTSVRALIKLEPGIHPREVAAQADAGLTAYHAIKKARANLNPGSLVAVIGAGGLGHIGIQCLKAMTPAEIIVIDQAEEALELAKKLGADYTVLAGGTAVARVKEITGGKGCEVVLDFVGEGDSVENGLAMLASAGSYYVIGYGGEIKIPTQKMVGGEFNLVGNRVGTYNDLFELMALTRQGKVSLHNNIFPLEAALEAIKDLENGKMRGRAILVP